MKGLQIAVVLLVLGISISEALKCNSCVYQDGQCNDEPEQCEDKKDVCGTVTATVPRFMKSKSCMTGAEVALVSQTNHFTVTTCKTDLCN